MKTKTFALLKEKSVILFFLCFILLCYSCTRQNPILDKFFPNQCMPGDLIYVQTHNLPDDLSSVKIMIGGIACPVENIIKKPVNDPKKSLQGRKNDKLQKQNEAIFVVKTPNLYGEVPIGVNYNGKVTTSPMVLKIKQPITLKYTDKGVYKSTETHTIDPAGFGQKVLVLIGHPTDVIPNYTINEITSSAETKFDTVNTYWNTTSMNNLSMECTVHQEIVPLIKSYGEYIVEVRNPSARGQAVGYITDTYNEVYFDIASGGNNIINMEIERPDGTTLHKEITIDYPTWSEDGHKVWFYNILWDFYSNGILVYFIEAPGNQIFLELVPFSDGVENIWGDGYSILSISGDPCGVLGLSSPSYTPGSGDPNSSGIGSDLDRWDIEIDNYVNLDYSEYSSVNYMLVGKPKLENIDFTKPNLPYGYLESHGLRASATVGYGWMRLNANTSWNTWAHETGHNIGFWDQYQDSYSQPGQFVGGWTTMAYEYFQSHVTAWEKHYQIEDIGYAGWIPSSTILSAEAPGPDEETHRSQFCVIPQHNAIGDIPGNNDPVAYAIEIPLSVNHKIIIENRNDQPSLDPKRFDEKINEIDPAGGGIVIYDARLDLLNAPNVWRRQLILLSPYDNALKVGESYQNEGVGIGVTVLEKLGSDHNASYRVAVDWGSPNLAEGELFDAYITPWDSHWQSTDIWVDSPLNGYDVYESSLNSDGNPSGQGDKVGVGEENILYARIHNTGPNPISNAKVNFWVATPAGIGDRGDWQQLTPDEIGPIDAGSSVLASTKWIASGSGHTCIIVEIFDIGGEISFANNRAQENFSNFETSSSSPFTPIDFTFSLFNPFDEERYFALRPAKVPDGYILYLNHSNLKLEPNQKFDLKGQVITDTERIQPLEKYDADINIRAFTPFNDSEISIGGITIHVQPRIKTELESKIAIESGNKLLFTGSVKNFKELRTVTFVVHQGKDVQYYYGRIDKSGSFHQEITIKDMEDIWAYCYVPMTSEFASVKSEVFRSN